MQGEIECRYCGRDFTAAEMRLMRALIEGPPMRSRSQLAKAFCRSIGWTKPDGGLKEMMARATMLKMHRVSVFRKTDVDSGDFARII